MAAALKLVYFPVQARGEAIRMCLAYGKVPYQEVAPTAYFGCSWREGAKNKTPFGGLPIIEADGKVISQSGSCVRYCAALADLIPSDTIEAAQCDAIFEYSQDLSTLNPIVNVFRGDVFAQKKEEYFSTFPTALERLTKQLKGPFFLGEKPSYCDFGIYHVLSNARYLSPTCLDAHDSIKLFMKSVEALDGVKEYLEQRPTPVEIGVNPRLQ